MVIKNLIVKCVIFSLVCLGLVAQAQAQDWMQMDVRGIKPGMTFSQVSKVIEKTWPKAKVRKRYRSIKQVGQSFKYGAYIELKDRTDKGYEKLKIEFLPPVSIAADGDSSTVKRIGRTSNFRKAPIERAGFVKALMKKYGQPTYMAESNVKWIFDADRKLLTEKNITEMKQTKEKKCSDLDKKRRNTLKQMQDGDQNASSRHSVLSRLLSACRRDLISIKTCYSNIVGNVCPFFLNYGWTTTAETKGFILGYGVDFYGLPLDSQESKNIALLQKQLKQRARKIIRENAASGAQPDL